MKRISFLLLLFFHFGALCQPGSLDLNFNPNDPGFGFGRMFNSTINKIELRSDGKYLCFGPYAEFNGNPALRFVVLDEEGLRDESFSVDPNVAGEVISVSQTSGDKIYIGGEQFPVGDDFHPLGRLNADGSIDLTFELEGSFEPGFADVTVVHALSDGSVIVSGDFDTYNGLVAPNLLMFNSDGTRNLDFDPGIGLIRNGSPEPAQFLTSDNQGRIIACGNFNEYNGQTVDGICRINPDGTLDADFSNNFELTPPIAGGEVVYTAAVLPDGKIAVGGNFGAVDGFESGGLILLNDDGTRDENFDLPENGFNVGFSTTNAVRSLALHPSGALLVGGRFTELGSTFQANFTAVNLDGSLNENFSTEQGTNGQVNTIAVDDNQDVIFGGNFEYFEYRDNKRIVKLDQTGMPVEGFARGNSFSEQTIKVLPVPGTNDVYVAGYFSHYKNEHQSFIARLDSEGNLVESFNPGIGIRGSNSNVSGIFAMAVQPDGKPIVAGTIDTYDGDTEIRRVVRLNTDGTLDEGFDIGGEGANFTLGGYRRINVDNQNRIYIAGGFFQWNGTPAGRIVRLNPDGSRDENYNPGNGPNNGIRALAIDNLNRVYLAGDFNAFNGELAPKIVRLNEDGTLDESFNPDLFNSFQTDINELYWNGDHLLAAGNIELNDEPGVDYSLVALSSEGTLFEGVSPYQGPEADLISVGPTGHIVLGLSQGSGSLIRLTPDGMLDETWDAGTGFESGFLFDISTTEEGSLYAAGGFRGYNGIGRQYIAKIDNSVITNTQNISGEDLSMFPNPAKDFVLLNLDQKHQNKILTVYTTDGKVAEQILINDTNLQLDLSEWKAGMYILRIGDQETKLVKQ
jgi:uncharacterized delta-60 repeat protein